VEEIEPDIAGRLRGLAARLRPPITALPLAVTLPIEPVDILRWLDRRTDSPRLYWSGRNGALETGGTGIALAVAAREPADVDGRLASIEAILRAAGHDPHLRFIGGRRFDPEAGGDALWKDFPPLWFGIPRISVTRTGRDHRLTVTVRVTRETTDTAILDEIAALLDSVSLDAAEGAASPGPDIISREDAPGFEGWTRNIRRSLREIDEGRVQKVVLARRTDLRFTGRPDPFALLARLRERNRKCFGFLLEPRPGKAFVGVTPERLFRIEGQDIISEAISGTTGRGDTPPGAPRVPLYSEKNLREHQYVIDDIASRIAAFCDRVHSPEERSAFDLSNVSHIYSRVAGRLRDGVSIAEVVASLHPTPAVGGTPRETALPLMRELEPFDRGWYAAPVGIIGAHGAEMAVAIRSAVVEEDRASLFAGAGIVAGSTPGAEWRELEQKISHAVQGLRGALP
jgi:menaquinone-specific isochorismate synthase